MAQPISYPFSSLGIITATTAGTPVKISTSALPIPAKGIWVTAIKAKGTANTGANMYILDSAGNILFVIPKTATVPIFITASIPGFQQAFDLTNLWLDADSSGDGLNVTYEL